MQKPTQEADKTKDFPYGSGIPSLWKELVGKCHCEKCLQEDYDERLKNGTPFKDLVFTHPIWMMILCQKCGNKRCSHAADHDLPCNNSNEPGQPGSSYEHCIVPPKEEEINDGKDEQQMGATVEPAPQVKRRNKKAPK